jgi:hypothetical protein
LRGLMRDCHKPEPVIIASYILNSLYLKYYLIF